MEKRDHIRQEWISVAFVGFEFTNLAIWHLVSVSAPDASVPVGVLCLLAVITFGIWTLCQGDPRWKSRGQHCRVMATPRQPSWKTLLWLGAILGAILGPPASKLFDALFK